MAILSGSVPTGSGAYILAKQMGGDAPLVANILTLQVLCAAITIPLIMTLAGLVTHRQTQPLAVSAKRP